MNCNSFIFFLPAINLILQKNFSYISVNNSDCYDFSSALEASVYNKELMCSMDELKQITYYMLNVKLLIMDECVPCQYRPVLPVANFQAWANLPLRLVLFC